MNEEYKLVKNVILAMLKKKENQSAIDWVTAGPVFRQPLAFGTLGLQIHLFF